jgi:hypothetical protein
MEVPLSHHCGMMEELYLLFCYSLKMFSYALQLSKLLSFIWAPQNSFMCEVLFRYLSINLLQPPDEKEITFNYAERFKTTYHLLNEWIIIKAFTRGDGRAQRPFVEINGRHNSAGILVTG